MLYNEEIKAVLKNHDMSLISYCNNAQMYGLQIRIGNVAELLSFSHRKLGKIKDLEMLINTAKEVRDKLHIAVHNVSYSKENRINLVRLKNISEFRAKTGCKYVRSSSGYAYVGVQQYTKISASTRGYVTRFVDSLTGKKTSQFFRVDLAAKTGENSAFIEACHWVDNHIGVELLQDKQYLAIKKTVDWNSWKKAKLANSAQDKSLAS